MSEVGEPYRSTVSFQNFSFFNTNLALFYTDTVYVGIFRAGFKEQ